jgi:hypothetical protein
MQDGRKGLDSGHQSKMEIFTWIHPQIIHPQRSAGVGMFCELLKGADAGDDDKAMGSPFGSV